MNQISLPLFNIRKPPLNLQEIIESTGVIQVASNDCLCGNCTGFFINVYRLITKRQPFGRGVEENERHFQGGFCSKCDCQKNAYGHMVYCAKYHQNLPDQIVVHVDQQGGSFSFSGYRKNTQIIERPLYGTLLKGN